MSDLPPSDPTPAPLAPEPAASELEALALVARAAADKAVREVLGATQKPATVLEYVDNVATVHVDGDPDDVTIAAESLVVPSPYPNARVMVQFHPPNAVFVSGWITRADPPGEMKWFSTDVAPPWFLVADGAAHSRADYSALFAAIGTKYGAGDGSTTFNVPDAVGRFFMGAGDGTSVGATGGAATVALTESNLPPHSHSISSHVHGMTHDHDLGFHAHSISSHFHGMSHDHGVGNHSHTFSANTDNQGFHNHILDIVKNTGATVHAHHSQAGRLSEAPFEGAGNAADAGTVGNGGHTHGIGGNTSSAGGGTTGLSSRADTTSAGSGNTGSTDPGGTGLSSRADTTSGGSGSTGSIGSGQAHENMPPWIAFLPCISY